MQLVEITGEAFEVLDFQNWRHRAAKHLPIT